MRLALAALCLAAAPALARGEATSADQFAAAARAFFLPTVESLAMADAIEDDAILAVLPGLRGDWMPATTLFRHAEGFDASLLAQACGRIAWTLEQTAPRSFALRHRTERDGAPVSLTVRYDWMTGNAFDRGVDENELVAVMSPGADGEIHPLQLQAANMRGHASLFHPSPDVLVIVAPGMPADILMRCPA